MIYISDTQGHITFGSYAINWGNALDDIGLAGFFAINLGNLSIEFGDVDQGKPGIYMVSYADGEIVNRRTIWQAK